MMNKSTKKIMLGCLKEWADLYFHEINCSEKYLQRTIEHHNQAYQSIWHLIEKFSEWQERAEKIISQLSEKNLYPASRIRLKQIRFIQEIREFGKEIK